MADNIFEEDLKNVKKSIDGMCNAFVSIPNEYQVIIAQRLLQSLYSNMEFLANVVRADSSIEIKRECLAHVGRLMSQLESLSLKQIMLEKAMRESARNN